MPRLLTATRVAIAGLILAASAALAACGFTPLYATPGLSASLSATEVIAPSGRTGQLLMEKLRDELAVSSASVPAYRLNLAIEEQRYPRGLRAEDAATYYELSVRVSYSLVERASGTTIAAGVVPVNVTYDAVRDPYAGITAQQDGQERAAAEVARRIRLDLSAKLAGRSPPTP